MVKKLMRSIREYKKASLLAPIYVACEVILEVLIPYLMAGIIDIGIAESDMNYIYTMGTVLIVAAMASLFCGFMSGRYAAIASAGFAKNLREEQIKTTEGELILSRLAPGDHVVLLDENGRLPDGSVAFSEWLQGIMNRGTRKLVFVVGGAYGFSAAVYARANEKISLSRMTFSHQMVRLIFVEQLYRAFTILNGEPYHHR